MDEVGAVVVGAGVVGLAVARALALAGHEVIVLEREERIGSHTSARNSEVIHAGIYYPRDSAKAAFCRAGREALYAFCASHGVAHRRLGKIIVAGAAELREPHRVARFLEELASAYHSWYDACRVLPLGEEPIGDLHRTRLWLNDAAGQVLRNGLDLIGVSAPERL